MVSPQSTDIINRIPALPAISSLHPELLNIHPHQNRSSPPTIQQITLQTDNLIHRSGYQTGPMIPAHESPYYQDQQNAQSEQALEGHQRMGLQEQKQQEQEQQEQQLIEHMWEEGFMEEFLFQG
jgi:hypothetical protein